MCSFGVFAFFGVGAGVGVRGLLCFGCPALVLVWCSYAVCGRFWRVRGGVCAVACAGLGGKVGAGRSCPAPTVWLRPRCVRLEERGGAHGVVNTPLSCDRLHGNG